MGVVFQQFEFTLHKSFHAENPRKILSVLVFILMIWGNYSFDRYLAQNRSTCFDGLRNR